MAEGYRIIGAEMSPYSVKVRSYFRYKAIPHQWVLRNAASQVRGADQQQPVGAGERRAQRLRVVEVGVPYIGSARCELR